MTMVALMHLVLFTCALIGAYLVRFDFAVPEVWAESIKRVLPALLICKMAIFGVLKMYQGWWRYVSLYDIVTLFRALVISTIVFVAVNVMSNYAPIPRSIYLIDLGLSLIFIGGARGSLRLLREMSLSRRHGVRVQQNALILGAGDTAETLIREIGKNIHLPYNVVGFLDDDARTHGLRIHDVPVLGGLSQMSALVEKHAITTAIIAMPSATREQLRRAVELATDAQLQTRIVPSLESMFQSGVKTQLREVSISDLLGRDAVKLDMQSLGRFIQGRTVLVTGAGGSIGSELCRQVLRFDPSQLVMVERAETPLFFIERELRAKHADRLRPYIADIADEDRVREIFEAHRPQVVIHAAAYKHVPLMEANPCEAVRNNVRGSQVVADVSIEAGVEAFVLISTDKAVNPTSVMGATKRVTELYIMQCQQRQTQTRFSAVRFGNVLGSNGSVVPIFTEQIKQGGPLTVTHPEMTRYFMTIPEAVQLVLQAGALGEGGEIFILDMGEPVKIADLARDMIRLSGLDEQDIEIVYSGVRPGEKLFEELAIDHDNLDRTKHDQIFVAKSETQGSEHMQEQYALLLEAAVQANALSVRQCLKSLIPSYRHKDLPENVVIFQSGKHKSVS